MTGRYPRGIVEFNVGVLRWTWHVGYHAYSALATDVYPPITLAEMPDHPASSSVEHPERPSRGLVLVTWWLLAIPQYVVIGLPAGPQVLFQTDQGTRYQGQIGLAASAHPWLPRPGRAWPPRGARPIPARRDVGPKRTPASGRTVST